jgi:Gpi18-like mannosyltransferase
LILIAFNAGFFANPVIWGQSDIMAVLALTGTFFLVYRKQALWGGLALGLTAISKPQAWFVLPLLAWILVQRCGWRKGGGGLALGGILALSMATIAFGFDTKSVANYFNQPEFAGNYSYKYVTALNLNRLVVGSGQVTTVPSWLSLLGFVVVGLVMLGVLFTRTGRQNSLKRDGLAGTLLVVTCFSWLIKMKERYLIYSFPFLGIAALEDRRLFKPHLALSWLQLIQLLTTLFDYSPLKKVNLTFYPFLWTRVLSQDWSDYVLSTCTMLLFFYLGYVYLKQVRRTPKPDQTEPKPELQEAGNIK